MGEYILIVEDNSDINRMLCELLEGRGFRVAAAFSGTEALLYIEKEIPDAVLLDLMIPGISGEELLVRLKKSWPEISVIIISAKDAVYTRVELLRAGADDYMVKPFDTEELLARLEVVLRRNGRTAKKEQEFITYKDICMEPDCFKVTVAGKEVVLTKREYLILELFMRNPGKIFTKNNIYESVWNEEYLGEDNAVNVHISNIRQKLAKINSSENYIQTVWGIGFKLI